jgi:energy-coupling factor transporter ATP-binding protein EcfA2
MAVAEPSPKKPPCLVMDEATTMLDPGGRQDLMEVSPHFTPAGWTWFHNPQVEEILRCDRCIVLSGGRISWNGTPWELFLLGEELAMWVVGGSGDGKGLAGNGAKGPSGSKDPA